MQLRAYSAGLVALVIVAACTTTKEVHVPVTYEEKPDASKPVITDDDDDTEVVPRVDAGKDSGGNEEASTGLTPTSKTTAVVTIQNVKRTLERAQFGRDADGTFHIEAHEGGDPKCPDQTSPSPKRTLIITGVKHAAAGAKETKADGVNASFLDFVGDQLPEGTPFTKATAITVEIVAIKGAAGAETGVELDVDATFAEGTVKGRVYAEYCQSLSE